jgi:hypothetical protein
VSIATDNPRHDWLTRLYVAVAIVAIVPIWCVRYLPTVDGPSHLYNSWILKQLIRGAHGPLSDWFRIDWQPHPNWIGHAVMALLMTVVSPIIAEKLFVTGIVLLFLYAIWRYAGVADEANRVFAFLAVPFAYNLMLQNGFYNFCAGVDLYFLTVAVWWRRRHRPDARTIAITSGLLLLCYFSHALPAALAAGSIGLLWLISLRGQRLLMHARHLIALLPVAPLLLWFGPVGGKYLQGPVRRGELFRWVARMRMLYTFDQRQLVFGMILSILLGTLIVATLIRRRWKWSDSNAFLLLSVVVVAIYAASQFVIPDVQERLSLFVVLMPLAWLDSRVPRRTVMAIGVVLALAYCGYIINRYRVAGSHLARFVRSADAVGRQATLLPFLYEIGPPGFFVPFYSHAIDYVALKKESVDIANYEPVLAYFPIALQAGVVPANIFDIAPPQSTPNPAFYASRAQFIFIWRLDSNPDLRARMAPLYRRVGGSGDGAVFARVDEDYERILLPLVGTTSDRGAPAGMWWRVEQSVRNIGGAPITVLISECTPTPCALDLAPGAGTKIAADAPYAYALVPRSDAANAQFATTLRRADPAGMGAAVAVRAVREQEFRAGHLVIDSVPFTDPFRVTLRVWTQGERPQSIVVAVRDAAGRKLGEKSLAIDGNGAGAFVDLVHDFADVPQRREPVSITVDAAGGAKLWALVSSADPNTPTPAILYPR